MLTLYALVVPTMDWLGVALLLLALALFLVDLKVTNHGVPAIGGVIALILGTLVLFDATSPYSWLPIVMLVGVVIIVGALFIGIFGRTLVAEEQPVATGMEGMIGEVGVVRVPVGTGLEGWVFVRGELWRALAAMAPEEPGEQPPLEIGRKVEVVGLEDGRVLVLPVESVES